MAVIHCKETTNRSGGENADENADERVRTWQLLTDDATDGVGIVLAHGELPLKFDPWQSVNALGIVTETNADLICVSRTADQNDPNDLMNWTFVARYAGRDPITLPAEVEVDQVDYQVSLIDDVNGDPITNSADVPFESGVLADRSRGLIRITKNLDEWNAQEMEAYRDSLNNNIMFASQWAPGFAVGTLKMRSLTAKRVPYPGNQAFYWRATAVMETNLDGWTLRLWDQGRKQKGAVHNLPFMPGGLTDKDPFLLDGAGLRLPVGGSPVPLSFDIYPLVDWSGLTWLEF